MRPPVKKMQRGERAWLEAPSVGDWRGLLQSDHRLVQRLLGKFYVMTQRSGFSGMTIDRARIMMCSRELASPQIER